MIAFHGALTTVNHVDHLRRRFEATQQLVTSDDRYTLDEVDVTSTVEAHRWKTRARSLPPDSSEETMYRRLVSRGTQTSVLAGYITAVTDNGDEDKAWLRRIDAMDLSFPVSRHSELRGFLADTLALAERRGDVDGKRAATSKPRTPQMKRRRWAACDLCFDDEPTASGNADDQSLTVLDDDPEEWTDDDDDRILSSESVYGGSDCIMRPMIAQRIPSCHAAETRSYFRFGCRTVSRLPAPNMPMIREDEQSSSADDEDPLKGDIPIPNHRSPPPPEPPPAPEPPQKSSTCGQGTHCSSETAISAAAVELTSCCRLPVETPTNHDHQAVPPTSTSPSLLDTMHKKYCANQYARHQAPSTHGCHGNTHLLDVNRPSMTLQKVTQPSTDRDRAAELNDVISRQTDVAEPVTENHVTSSCRGVCDAAPDAAVSYSVTVTSNDANARFSTTDAMSMSLSTARFDDEGDENDDEEENAELKDEVQRNKTARVYDDQPWKKRFCDNCHGELEVKRLFTVY